MVQTSWLREWWAESKGLVYIFIAEMFGALMSALARLLETGREDGSGLHPFQLLCTRFVITLSLSYVYMYFAKTPGAPFGPRELRKVLVFRGFAGFFGVTGLYFSLQYLPIAEATVITFITPLLASFAASIFLNEAFGLTETMASVVSFLGVVLITRPGALAKYSGNKPQTDDPALRVTPAQRLFAIMMALVGVLGGTAAYTLIRFIGHRAHPLISVNYYASTACILSAVLLLILPNIGFQLPADAKEWIYLVLLGISGFLLQFLFTTGLQHANSNRAMNMMYTSMLGALALDKLIWNVVPDWISCIGGLLILGSTAIIAILKEKRKDSVSGEGANERVDEEGGLLAEDGLLEHENDQEEEHRK